MGSHATTRPDDDDVAALERALCAELEAQAAPGALGVQAQRDDDGRVAVYRFYELADVVTDADRQLSLSFARARIPDLEHVAIGDEVGLELEPLPRLAERARIALDARGRPLSGDDVTIGALDEALAAVAGEGSDALWRALEARGPALLTNGAQSLVGDERRGRSLELFLSSLVFSPEPIVLAKARVRAKVVVRHGARVMAARDEEVLLDVDDAGFFRPVQNEVALRAKAEHVRWALQARLAQLAWGDIVAPTPAEVFAPIKALRAVLDAAG